MKAAVSLSARLSQRQGFGTGFIHSFFFFFGIYYVLGIVMVLGFWDEAPAPRDVTL